MTVEVHANSIGFGSNCVVCGIQRMPQNQIHSKTGKQKRLEALLLKFSHIEFSSGVICCLCTSQLKSIESKISQITLNIMGTYKKYTSDPTSIGSSTSENPQTQSMDVEEDAEFATPGITLHVEDSSTQIPVYAKIVKKTVNSNIEAGKDSSGVNESNEMTDHPYCGENGPKTVPPIAFAGYVAQCMDHLSDTPAFKEKMNEIEMAHFALSRRKGPGTSVLFCTNYDSKSNLDFPWNDIYEEFFTNFPELCQLILSVMLPADRLCSPQHLTEVFPRLGMIYAIMAHSRNSHLSRVQRMMAHILLDSMCDWRIHAMFAQFGLSVSYNMARMLVKQAQGHPTLEKKSNKNNEQDITEPIVGEVLEDTR